MSITDTINQRITESMKSGDQVSLDAFRMTKTALQNAAIAKADHTLTPDEEIQVIQREVKKRREAAEMYKTGERVEMAQKELAEATLLEQFLPAQISDQDIEAVVKQAIATTGATNAADTGKVMAAVMPALKGQADGARVSAVVRQLLQG